MKGEPCVAHAAFLWICMLLLTIFVLANQACSLFRAAPCQMPGHSPTELWIKKTNELTGQERPTHTIAPRGSRCPLKEEVALWAFGRLMKDRQVPLRTKIHVNIKTKKFPVEAKISEHHLMTWNQPAQNKVPPPDPILTNLKLGLKRSPTLTAWTTKGKLETL